MWKYIIYRIGISKCHHNITIWNKNFSKSISVGLRRSWRVFLLNLPLISSFALSLIIIWAVVTLLSQKLSISSIKSSLNFPISRFRLSDLRACSFTWSFKSYSYSFLVYWVELIIFHFEIRQSYSNLLWFDQVPLIINHSTNIFHSWPYNACLRFDKRTTLGQKIEIWFQLIDEWNPNRRSGGTRR